MFSSLNASGSASTKRKVDEVEDSDEEEPMLGRQVLPVANLPDSFDGVPVDGFQYLFTVRRDARLLPHVTRVANPYELPDGPPPDAGTTVAGAGAGTDADGAASTSTSRLPSEEWRATFLRRFRNFRKNSVQPTIHIERPETGGRAKVMPDRKERDLWWAFLAGRPEREWNPPKKAKAGKQSKAARWQQRSQRGQAGNAGAGEERPLPYDLSETSVSMAESTLDYSGFPLPSMWTNSGFPSSAMFACELWGQGGGDELGVSGSGCVSDGEARMKTSPSAGPEDGGCTPREPTPGLLQHIDHRYAVHLLMYFGHWIHTRLEEGRLPYSEVTEGHARWMFALLSRVDDWLSGDETSVLRTVARGCLELMVERRKRAVVEGAAGEEGEGKGEEEDEAGVDERSLWLIVTAIIGIWGQTDLWADAESMLSKVD